MEPTTGATFPGELEEGRLYTGTGLRKKSILGLKKINVYAYGGCFTVLIYALIIVGGYFYLNLHDVVVFHLDETRNSSHP